MYYCRQRRDADGPCSRVNIRKLLTMRTTPVGIPDQDRRPRRSLSRIEQTATHHGTHGKCFNVDYEVMDDAVDHRGHRFGRPCQASSLQTSLRAMSLLFPPASAAQVDRVVESSTGPTCKLVQPHKKDHDDCSNVYCSYESFQSR